VTTAARALPAPVVRHRGRPAWRILASVLTLAALLWGTLNVVNLLSHGERRFTRTFSADGIARIDVSTDRGSVRVIASDRDDIAVSAYVSDGLGDTDDSLRVRGNRLLVDGDCTFPVAYWCTASYTLRVPRGLALNLWSGSGDVSVRGRTGVVQLTSQHGDINAVGLRGVDAEATADHGSVHLQFVRPPFIVKGSSAHGDVTVVVPRTTESYHVELSTDHGDATNRVRTDPGSDRVIDLSSQHGDVAVRYAPR